MDATNDALYLQSQSANDRHFIVRGMERIITDEEKASVESCFPSRNSLGDLLPTVAAIREAYRATMKV